MLAAGIFLAGCLSTKYFQQNKFMLHIKMPKTTSSFRHGKILQLKDPVIIPQFANNAFVYRTSQVQYQVDSYNVFFIPAFQQIKQLLTEYLSKTPFISQVVDTPSLIPAGYVLSSKILALYADYRDRNNPKEIGRAHV